MSSSAHSSPRDEAPLGLVTTTALVVASMIGAGLFTTSGFALGDLGTPERVLAAWLVGGVVAVAGAIGYGALARRVVESGGEYVYLSRRLHPLAGFLAGWVSLVAGFTASMAFAATALEIYALPLLPSLRWLPPNGLAIGIILLSAAVHAWRTAPGAAWQAAIVIAKVVGLVLLAIAGAVAMAGRATPAEVVEPHAFNPFVFANSLVWISLAFAGFNAAVYMAEEVREAQRNVPRAMLLGTVAVALLYFVLNALMVYSGPVAELAGKKDIAAIAAQLLGGRWAELACRVLIVAAMLTSVSALTMSGPRVYAKMAEDRLFPLPRRWQGETPWGAIWLQATLACLVVLNTTLRTQLDYLGFMLSLSAAATVATLLLPGQVRDLRVWELLAALVFVVATLTFALLAAWRTGNPAALAALGTVVPGLVAYGAMRGFRSRPLPRE